MKTDIRQRLMNLIMKMRMMFKFVLRNVSDIQTLYIIYDACISVSEKTIMS